uniref:Photosystem II reaction center Psb28 protein n=1 Tax=Pseudellipsoidion edaphicum TaxID=1431838 RepID=A0A3R5QP06_9STRA|nr:photosystem II protein psb28 [Pseudellipsoidion edaphicum]QAA11991.1 photosystem II protein psb28 [Pseudellipsoidion edaphicum]
MTIKIQFLLETKEIKDFVPDKIRLTRSLNQETGTILLSFSKVFSLDLLINKNKPILGLYLTGKNFSFFTKEIRCIWRNGQPILIQAIFLIDKKEELNMVFKVFKDYAKKNGLINSKID